MRRVKNLISKIKKSHSDKIYIYPQEFTYLRQHILKSPYRNFTTLLKISNKSPFKKNPRSYHALKVLSLCPKYFEDNENLVKFKKDLARFSVDPNYYPFAFNAMAGEILLSELIEPELKIFFFARGQPSVNTHNLSLDVITIGIHHFAKGIPSPISFGVYQLIYQALARPQFNAYEDLNTLLMSCLQEKLHSPNKRNFEQFLKKIIQSPHLEYLDNHLYKLCLDSWGSLINQAQTRFDYNNHHQTKKKLKQLRLDYLEIRDRFRTILKEKSDPLAQLDSFLMG